MSNHTLAPWCTAKTGDYRAAFRVTDKDGWTIALCYQQPRDEWSVEANVNLIKAAPKLYEALRKLVDYNNADPDLYVGDDDGVLGRIMYEAQVALGAATRSEVYE